MFSVGGWLVNCRDAEEADIEKERKEQAKGPAARAHELEELTAIYEDRGLSHGLARQVTPQQCILEACWTAMNHQQSTRFNLPSCKRGSFFHQQPIEKEIPLYIIRGSKDCLCFPITGLLHHSYNV